MTTPRTKHSEYKRKLVEWARIFEQEYGTSPTEEDRVASNTWNALNDKATYYKRMLKEQSVASSPSLQTPSPSGRRSSGSRRESSSRESRSRESSSRDKSRSRFGVRSHESSPDLLQKSRSPDLRASSSPEKSRRRSSRPVAEEEIVFDTAETAEAAADPGPPPLPEVPPALVEHPEVASLEAKARESREKLLKWERAYEREQGDPPRPEDRAASSTYTSYERKYDAYRSQLELLLAELKGQPVGAQIGPGDAPTRKKRLAISAEAGAGIADMGTIPVTHAVIPKGPEAEAAIEEASKNCVLFSGLGAAESRTVVDAMFEVRASAGQTLINEGEKGDNFYIVQGGNYAVFLKAVGPNPVVTYGRGDSFGESVLPRTTTIAHTSSKPHASSLQPPASQASSLSCALHVHCMCTACALHVHVRYMCTACALHVRCMCIARRARSHVQLPARCHGQVHSERRAVGFGPRHVPHPHLLQAGTPQPAHRARQPAPQPALQPAPRIAHGSLSRAAHLYAGPASDETYIAHTRTSSAYNIYIHICISQASEDRELATFLGSVALLSSLTQAQLGRPQP